MGSTTTDADTGNNESFGTMILPDMVACWAQCGVVGKAGVGVKAESKSNRVSGDDIPVLCDPCRRVLRF